MSVYHTLVNRKAGIAYRYHKFHDKAVGVKRIFSWLYLLWLNLAYYLLFCRFLGEVPVVSDTRRMPPDPARSESQCACEEINGIIRNFERTAQTQDCLQSYISILKKYDVVSFDVFDTLIFRPLSQPKDLFYFIGEQLGVLDFKNVRTQVERNARRKKQETEGHTEVTIREIWQELAEMTGLPAEEGMRIETETEEALCYANPFLFALWEKARKLGKKIIVISDMYLPEKTIRRILEKNGFTGAEKIYVSCEYGNNKAGGGLYRVVCEDQRILFPSGRNTAADDWNGQTWELRKKTGILHIGDNPHSDVEMAKRAGYDALLYPQIRRYQEQYRPYDMSCLVGSAYRGIVSSRIYNGLRNYSTEYEYGFLYGGLFVLGYCDFIHRYAARNDMDKILFLSRDGDILKQAYDFLYPSECTEYVHWSRKAGLKLMADEDRRDYFRRFVYHKVNQGYTIGDVLRSMELEFLTAELSGTEQTPVSGKHPTPVSGKHPTEEELTERNALQLCRFIKARWGQVKAAYAPQRTAAEKYFRELLKDCKKAVVVDIGWAGSGAVSISHLIEKRWNFPCEVSGIIAGTNTIHNAEPDASEPFLQSGKLTAYLYSQRHNRDLLKKHDPNRDYNVYWELLLSSPQPQFEGYYEPSEEAGNGGKSHEQRCVTEGGIELRFGRRDVEPEKAAEIQRGILDFVKEYRWHFLEYPYMLHISGRDAYAPMLLAAGHKERYLRMIAKRFRLRKNVE